MHTTSNKFLNTENGKHKVQLDSVSSIGIDMCIINIAEFL